MKWWNVHIKIRSPASVHPVLIRTATINCWPLFSINHTDTMAHDISSHFYPLSQWRHISSGVSFRLSRSMITDQETSGHKARGDLINGRAAITVVVYVLSWYLDLQAHPFWGLKSRGVITGAKRATTWQFIIDILGKFNSLHPKYNKHDSLISGSKEDTKWLSQVTNAIWTSL